MDTAQPGNSALRFIFSATPNNALSATSTNDRGSVPAEAFTTTVPPTAGAPGAPYFSLGIPCPDNAQRSAGRSSCSLSSSGGNRRGPTHRHVSAATGVKHAATTPRLGAASSPGRAEELVPVTVSADSDVNALDQLISMLLLPDDDPESGAPADPASAETPAAIPANAMAAAGGGASGTGGDAAHRASGAAGVFGSGGAGCLGGGSDYNGDGASERGRLGTGSPPGVSGRAGGPDSLRTPGGDQGCFGRLCREMSLISPVSAFRKRRPDAGDGSDQIDTNDSAILGLRALAAALDAVEASLEDSSPQDLVLPPDEPGPAYRLGHQEDDMEEEQEGNVVVDGAAGWTEPGQGQQLPLRRPKLVAKRATASTGRGQAAARGGGGDGSGGGDCVGTAGQEVEGSSDWKVMLAAPTPHNPESLATLLLAGRLVNPHTAVPAPLLAAAAREQRQKSRSTEGEAQHRESRQLLQGTQAAGSGGPGVSAAVQIPAVAVVRCGSEHDVAMALALNGRRLYAPAPARNGSGSWRPITVVLQSWPGMVHGGGQATTKPSLGPAAGAGSAPSSSPRGPRVRDIGPRVRQVLVFGLPGHLDGDDVVKLFGNGLQLPGHCATPQDRRFLVLCPDADSFSALMDWSGTRLPDKPLDALQQIVPRAASWSTVCVEEDDGVQLPALISQLQASVRLFGRLNTADSAAAARRQEQHPRVAGRFHPADLDEMDDMTVLLGPHSASAAAAAAARQTNLGGDVTARPSNPASVPAAPAADAADSIASDSRTTPPRLAAKVGAGSRCAGGAAPPVGRPAGLERSLEGRMDATNLFSSDDAAATAERAASSRGASSSGLAARPAPRFRRTAAIAGGMHQYAASAGAAGAFFGPGPSGGSTGAAAMAAAARCACCPLPSFGGSGSAGGGGIDTGAMSWSGNAAVELLNKLLNLGIEQSPATQGAGGSGGGSRPGAPGKWAQGDEDESAPFFRRSRKRMPVHFGHRPEDEEGEEDEAKEGGAGDDGTEVEAGTAAAAAAARAVGPGPAARAAAGDGAGQQKATEIAVAAARAGVVEDAEDANGGGIDDPS